MDEAAKQREETKVKNIVEEMKKNTKYIIPEKGSNEYGYETIKKILIFIEDTSSAVDFYTYYFRTCYPYANLTVVSTSGHGNIEYIPNYIKNDTNKYTYIIIIYDRGRSSGRCITSNNRKGIPRAIKKTKKITSADIFVYSPLCFESIALSLKILMSDFLCKYTIQESINTQLHRELVSILQNDITEINWYNYIKIGKSIENIIEDAIEDITAGTQYEISHKPSKISECWMKECLDTCDTYTSLCSKINTDGDGLVHRNKIELISMFSALGGLSYIFDKIYGIQYRIYPKAITENTKYKS